MYKLSILLIISIGLLVSCKRNFDEPNPNALTISNFWVSEADAIKGVNAVYSTLRRQASVYSRWMYYHRILRSDEGFGSGGDVGLNNLMSFVQTDYNNALTAETWQNLYVGVFRANQAIANIPNINMEENLRKRLIAEAKFMRGLFYFDLTLFWGRPPLILTPPSPSDQPANATNEEAWAQVIKDFTEAAPDLPESYASMPNEIGRATKGAAYAFIGKANLQQGKYQQAVDALNWLVEGAGKNVYSLTPNYRSNFIITSENNQESVFELQFAFKSNENGDDDINEAINLNSGASIAKFFGPSGIGFNDGAARKRWLVDTFMLEKTSTGQRDPRLAASFIFDSTDERGPHFTRIYGKLYEDSLGLPIGNMWFRKLLNDSTRTEEGFSSGNNYRMIRYADVLLMYAEALNGIGRTGDAYQYVNRVRTRVGMDPLLTGMNQARFLVQIKHERIVELSGEGWRWADLLRWGELSSDLKARDPEFTNFVKGRNEYYPIPQSDIDLNPNLKQNPGF